MVVGPTVTVVVGDVEDVCCCDEVDAVVVVVSRTEGADVPGEVISSVVDEKGEEVDEETDGVDEDEVSIVIIVDVAVGVETISYVSFVISVPILE